MEFKIIRKSVKIAPRRLPKAPKTTTRELRIPKKIPQSIPKGPKNPPQENPKTAQKRPKRTPKRSQDHLRIEDDDFSKIELPPRRELDF